MQSINLFDKFPYLLIEEHIMTRKIVWNLALTLILSVAQPLANDNLSWGVKEFAHYETKANAVADRSNDAIEIKHFEVPLSALEQDIADRVNPKVRDALVIEKNGEKFVRWIIHPEDTKFHPKVKEYLDAKGIPYTIESHFTGYLQASRSLVLFDPESKVSFSLKTSTNNTGGNWVDKKQEWTDAKEIRAIMDHMSEVYEKGPIKPSAVLMDEPLALGIKELDMAMVVRSLDEIDTEERTFLPAFSAVHETVGKAIAEKNGFKDPVQFWMKHYTEPLGRALAELAAITGLSYDSPHGQNFLIELDKNSKPTGRIVLRDLGDVFINGPVYENTRLKDIMPEFSGTKTPSFNIAFGPLHGNRAPSWLDTKAYTELTNAALEHFRYRFSEMTGVGINAFRRTSPNSNYGASYARLTWNNIDSSDEWKTYLSAVECFSGASHSLTGESCEDLLKKINPPQVPRFLNIGDCNSLLRQVVGL